jgi:hypothetical protein
LGTAPIVKQIHTQNRGNPTPYELNPFTYYEHRSPLRSTLTVVHAVPSLSEIPKHMGLELVLLALSSLEIKDETLQPLLKWLAIKVLNLGMFLV